MKTLFFRISKSIYLLIIGILMSQSSYTHAANLDLTTKELSRNSVESCYRYTLRNNTNSLLSDWKVSFNIFRVPNLFNTNNGYFTKTTKGYDITGVTGNNPIRPYASTDVDFCIRSTARPTSIKVTYRDGNGTTINTNTPSSTYKSSFTIKNDHKVTMEVDAMNTTSNRYCRNIRIINTGDLSIQSWRITFQTSNTITPWGATSSRSNNTFTLSPYRDTAALLAGEIRDIGFCSNGTDRDGNWKLETSLDTRYLGSSSNYYNQSYSPTTYNTTNSYSNSSTQYCYNSSTRSYEACGVSSVYTAPTCYNNVTGRYETCSNTTNTTYSSNPYCYNSVARVYEACNSMNNNTLYYYNSNTNSYEPYYNTNYSSQSNYTPLSDNSYSCYNSITRTYERCYYNSNTSYYPNYSNTNAGLPSPTTHTYIPTNGGTSSTNYYQNPNYGTYYPDSYNTNTVAVGPNREYRTIAAGVNAARDGDTVLVDAGIYYNEDITVNRRISIVGVGGIARIVGTTNISNGKAFVVTNADTTIENMTFENATVSDRNGAGIRYQGGKLMVKNSTFIGNQNGILGATDSNGVIIIDNSRFENNGYGDGYSHGIYIGEISSLTVMNSTFLGTRVGHHIKSRAATTIIQNNTLDDNNATTSYSIDLPNGGYATINGNTLIKSRYAENQTFIAYGAENGSRYGNNLLSVMNNTFRNNRSSSVGIYNHSQITATITNNIFENVSTQTIGLANVVGSINR